MVRSALRPVLAALVIVAAGCRESKAEPANAFPGAPSRPSTSAAAAPPPPAGPTTTLPHGWPHAASSTSLEARFREPAGFTRVPVTPTSFAAFLRSVPLAPEGAKVVDYRGTPLYEDGHHPNIAAVVDIDVGTRDLQQCADAVYRMHAEWRWATGASNEIRYRALSGVEIPYARYLAGDRAAMASGALRLAKVAAPHADDHAFFRGYLDDVFAWASTTSLERDGKKIDFADIAGGDAFVLPGSPFGHAVLVLDVARDAKTPGRIALLLGQSYMPAQSIHVLRPDPHAAWFVVEPDATEVVTPFWKPFPKTSLRRL